MNRIDDYPTHELNGIRYRIGRVQPYGATMVGNGGINFSVHSKDATSCSLVLYHRGDREPFVTIPYPEEFRIGNVYSMIVYDLNYEELEYGYKMDGPWDPARGLRFDKEKVLLDPYAHVVNGREIWGQETYPGDSFSIRGCVAPNDYSWEGDKPLEIPMRDLVIYEAHVRGFTKDPSSGVNYKGSYSGLIKKIPYLKELGINCIELLPVFEFDELENTHTYEGKTLYNYWGYSTVNFYSPKEGYARSALNDLASEEFKYLIKKMHQAGIEVILDVVFNHTAEGNELGPTISFRGIDNRTYYLLSPEGEYLNYSGCGNTINCNNAVTRGFIRNCLRYWVAEYHIDGFRFDLAAILSRDTEGNPMVNPPLLESLAQDVILGKCKLIAEAWDAAGLYQVGRFPAWHRWAEWNGRYRDCLRGFLKSGAECGPELIQRIQGSPDLYSTRGSDASVNFITCHDGFTLCDLVSYNEKHNEANGEGNQDGSNDNISWNCGVEGETDDPEIISLRKRQIKNAAALLLLSRGVPMLLAGDEFMNTQYGNNNAYCQDNEISWLNWDNLTEHADIFAFFKKMIAFRHAHPVLRRNDYHMGQNLSGYPELSFHGTRPWDMDTESPFLCFGFLYAEPAAEFGTEQDTFIYCAVNAFWEEKEFGLPLIPQGKEWEIVAYTGDPEDRRAGERVPDKVVLMPRSLMVLVGR